MDRITWDFRLFVIDALCTLLMDTPRGREIRRKGKELAERMDPMRVTKHEGE